MQNRSTLFLLMLAFSIDAYCQKPITKYPQNLEIFFEFKVGKIVDTNGLILNLTYKNKGVDTALVFSNLIDGDFYDPIGNLYCQMQILKGGKYIKYSDFPRDYFYYDSIVPPDRTYMSLLPQRTLKTNFNLISRTGFIGTGEYRVRFYILLLPTDPTRQYIMKYKKSKWFQFEVTKDQVGSIISH